MKLVKDILYVGNIPDSPPTASTFRVESISKSLVELNYNVLIYRSKNEQENPMHLNCFIRTTFVLKKNFLFNSFINYFKTNDLIKKIKLHENLHAIIFYNFPSYKLWKINKFCIKNDIICIADITEWYDPSTRDFPWNYLVRFDTYFRMRWVVPKLNRVICVSKALYQFYAPKVAQCAYIPSSVDKCDSKWINIKSRNQKSSITFGYIGFPGLKWEKDKIDWLVQIICELNDEGFVCNLELAGFSKSEFEKKYSQLCLFNHYQSSINFHGILNHEEGIDLIKKLDYSVIIREDKISTRFGFPTKLAESFACGTPVISTPSSNIADYIINGKNGFLSADFSFDSIKNTLKNSFSVSKSQYTSMRSFAETDNRLDYRQFTSDLRRLVGLA